MTSTPWYNAERVSQPGSTILNSWMADRQAQRVQNDAAATPVSEITPGTEMFRLLTGYDAGGAGIPVNEHTAMAVSAVYASVGLIGGAIAALPFHIFKRLPEGRERYDSDLWYLFNEQPWPNWTAASAWSWAAQSIGLRGDGYWRIHRVTPYSNQIGGFEPLHPGRVTPRREAGRNVYLVVEENGTLATVDQDDMLHFPGIGFDGLRSLTPIRAALRAGAGIALAADEFAASFFRNGARPDFVLKTSRTLSKEQREDYQNNWAARFSGPSFAHRPGMLTGDMTIQQLTMNAEDAQLIETRKFQIEDIARIFGVPPHMIGYTEKSSSWGAGVEQMSIGFVRYTLRRYLDSMRQEINRKVWPKSRQLFAEHNTDALLEGDAKAQAEYLGKALGGPGTQGWMTVNEVRRLKNLPPIDGGDKLIWAGAAAAPQPQPTEDEPAPPEKDDDDDDAKDTPGKTDGQ